MLHLVVLGAAAFRYLTAKEELNNTNGQLQESASDTEVSVPACPPCLALVPYKGFQLLPTNYVKLEIENDAEVERKKIIEELGKVEKSLQNKREVLKLLGKEQIELNDCIKESLKQMADAICGYILEEVICKAVSIADDLKSQRSIKIAKELFEKEKEELAERLDAQIREIAFLNKEMEATALAVTSQVDVSCQASIDTLESSTETDLFRKSHDACYQAAIYAAESSTQTDFFPKTRRPLIARLWKMCRERIRRRRGSRSPAQ
ncbi:uncharacterized protein LOC116617068 isoform X2 [Nematostella vectensis]|uniref:uncharacterized protein LOC116617068 isoform X2 n=1 Tax=Nematostella vectensis TaxID=45351 RepID=UPI0020777E50|nr:uncharacterized protein LOC116617068 isoform X2 [Nematostella vectensis]